MNSIVSIILSGLFLLTFFTSTLQAISQAYSYSDELLVVAVVVFALLNGGIKKEYFCILVLLILFWIYAFLSSFFSPYYRGFSLTFFDLFLFSKPLFLYIGMMNIPLHIIRDFSRRIMPLAYFYLYSAFVMYFLDLAIPIFPVFDQRFGFDSYSFISPNPGEFANLVFVSGILIYSISRSSNVRLVSIAMMTFLSVASLRFKAIVLALIYILLIIARWFGIAKSKSVKTLSGDLVKVNRLRLTYVFALLPFGMALGGQQFNHYYLDDSTPRLFLAQNAFRVATDFFPFGAGGGTFGSAVSKMNYSDLYYNLGFVGRWGLTDTDDRFLSDNFWPMIIAQYGVLGLLIVLVIYVMILRNLLRYWAPNFRLSIGIAMILGNLALSTLGSAILIGNIGVIMITALVFMLREV